ncbi:MAG: hypothetical protein WDN02_05145 [Methylovirgula sp.]|uniref:hypothetical protein n=1 Tax=Methylovirgula sp. TaxID=1978224 RepID=UPI0030768421
MVGPNGCGKSSLFDGLLLWYRLNAGFGFSGDHKYYQKSSAENFIPSQSCEVTLSDGESPGKGCLYIRTAFRNDPDFSVQQIQRPLPPTEYAKIGRLIENDLAVSVNFQRLIYDTMSGVYSEGNDAKTVQALREELIGGIRESMECVFGDLILKNISDPLGAGAFFFKKGSIDSYHYMNLSGGEKSAFDLLLDLHVNKKYFPNAIYLY